MAMDEQARQEWRNGWPLVAASMVAYAVSTTHVYTMGVFIGPIEAEYGWSRGQISSGLLVNSILTVVLSPFIGLMIDRYGPRRVGIPGMAAYCVMIALLSTTPGGAIWGWWGLWVGIALGASFIKPTLWAAAISRRFNVQRGLAFAVALCGSGIGSAGLPGLANWLVTDYGWRTAYVVLGVSFALVVLPLMLAFFHDTSRSGGPVLSVAARRAQQPGLGIREAMLSTRFLRLAAVSLIVTSATLGLTVHFIPIVTGQGLDRASAAAIVSTTGIASVIGRLGTGVLLDRWNGGLIGAASFTMPILAVSLLLTSDGSVPVAVLAAGLLGLALGAEIDIIAYTATRYFGLKNYGVVFGTISGFMVLGSGVGPMLAGMSYDGFASYDVFIWATIPAFVMAAAMIGSLGRYPRFEPAATAT